MSDVTRILSALHAGDAKAADELLPLVYDELRTLAAARLAREQPGQTLDATALVHEAYVRLVGGQRSDVGGQRSEELAPTSDLRSPTFPKFDGRGHFFAAAAEAMRRILVERARQKLGPRRGGDRVRLDLDNLGDLIDSSAEKIVAVDSALARLAEESPQAAELVKLRFFVGLTHQDAAAALGISRSTADRLWVYAKAALFCELEDLRR